MTGRGYPSARFFFWFFALTRNSEHAVTRNNTTAFLTYACVAHVLFSNASLVLQQWPFSWVSSLQVNISPFQSTLSVLEDTMALSIMTRPLACPGLSCVLSLVSLSSSHGVWWPRSCFTSCFLLYTTTLTCPRETTLSPPSMSPLFIPRHALLTPWRYYIVIDTLLLLLFVYIIERMETFVASPLDESPQSWIFQRWQTLQSRLWELSRPWIFMNSSHRVVHP